MKRVVAIVLLLVMAAILAFGCASENKGRNVGAVVGGVGGGVLGSKFGSGTGKTVATIAGAVLGAGLGAKIGGRMDEKDRVQMGEALENNENGQSLPWRSESSNTQYRVTPTRTYREGDRYCREFTQDINMDGRQETARGHACRQPDGTWQVVNLD